ncbi:hypothetical protein BRADI_2g48860v3 [Brachypodium distachyon]|uniref:Inhibitor I9 domain-containing protein n=1 Tax=Brachypodium distachyon TaxID=15368 RepID=I1HR72_BRADI|nr:hypothetical protein BRADI_2g48860v3 [Brachypodium distachyon]
MDIVPSILLPLLLISSAAATPSAISPAVAPAADEHASGSDIYIVFVSRADYVDSLDYDVWLLASVVGSTEEAKTAIVYHYSGLGFAARLTGNQADKLSKKEGVATFKDKTYYYDGRLPRFYEENI